MDDEQLTKTICTLLGRIPGWEWHETAAPYASTSVGVFYGPIDTTPHRAVGVRVYGTTDDKIQHLGWRRVQLRLRGGEGDPAGADRLADISFQVMVSLLNRLPGISDASRQSSAPLGADENRREERTENYLVILDNQEAQQ
ncbi:minor capsid protein [Marisediminicola sp. LYQ134]|uniref:phage tail terminator protein n=1 Tax=Marisediminicola sp. LYQ134 TaxID=3391061 RepID=UPI00398369FD